MAPPGFGVYVACLLAAASEWVDATTMNTSTALRFLSRNLGQDVTLECSFTNSVAVMFYWYKQTLGGKPEAMSKFYKHEKSGILFEPFKSDPRFQLDVSTGKNHLKISHVQSSDSATYFCVGGYSYLFEFLESVLVSVSAPDVTVPAVVHQSVSGSIQPRGSVTLNCTVQTGTCDGRHSVYWFKDSGEAQPGIIYTHGDRNDQCERKPDTQTCDYNLAVTNFTVAHAGTYYCAIASCGRILFSNGTKLDVGDVEDSFALVYVLSGALVFTTLLVVFLAYTAYRTYKANGCQCTDFEGRSRPTSAPNAEVHEDAENLHYAALKRGQTSRSTRQTDGTRTECVYSHVRS